MLSCPRATANGAAHLVRVIAVLAISVIIVVLATLQP
jgi:hypothetical protein